MLARLLLTAGPVLRMRCANCILFACCPWPCFSRTPGDLGDSRSAPMKETQTLLCFILFSKTTSLSGLGFLRPSSFSCCSCHLPPPPRSRGGASEGMLDSLHICQTYSSSFGQGVGAAMDIRKTWGLMRVKGFGEWSSPLSGLTLGGKKFSISYSKAQNLGLENAHPISDLPLDVADPCPTSLALQLASFPPASQPEVHPFL